MARRCRECRETAASRCERQLCGRHCWPPCAEDVHGQRRDARGAEGGPRRSRTRDLWKDASAAAEDFLDQVRVERNRRFYGLSHSAARHYILSGLLLLHREPDTPMTDDRIHDVLLSALPPGEIERILKRLSDASRDGAASSGRASASTGAAVEQPRVSEAAAPAGGDGDEDASASATQMSTTSSSSASGAAGSWGGSPKGKRKRKQRMEHACRLPDYDPQSVPALDENGAAVAHYRSTVPVRGELEKFPVGDVSVGRRRFLHDMGRQLLEDWIDQRPALRARLRSVTTRPFTWFDDSGNPLLDVHDVGCWMYLELKEWQPPPPSPVQNFTGRPSLHGNVFEEAVHCSSMYCLESAVVKGLVPGREEGRGGKTGVYAYRTSSRLKLAVSSSGYCVYDALCSHNIFFGPRFMLEVQGWRAGEPDIGRIGVGDGQICLQPNMFHLRGVYVHIVTPEDMATCPDTAKMLYYRCGRFISKYEMHPDDTRRP
jgi:hypothetical protein